MNKLIYYTESDQGSYEWLKLRKDFITGSTLARLMGKSTFQDEVSQIIARRLKPEPDPPGFISEAMEWGIETETPARLAYEMQTGNTVEQFSFLHDGNLVGISPDGLICVPEKWVSTELIHAVGAVEIYCPNTGNHIHLMRTDTIAPRKRWQISYYFYVIKSIQWLDFVSYDPRLEGKELFIKRITREDVQKDLDLIDQRILEAEKIINNF